MNATVNGMSIQLITGDITSLDVDAIVNPANNQLILGSGVAGAIRTRGGAVIQDECLRIGWCDTGDAVLTGAGLLRARFVIHAVGPRMGEGSEPGKLASATRASLSLAEQHQLASIALPAISTGVFGFPVEACAQIMLRVILDITFEEFEHLKKIVVCLFDAAVYNVFANEFSKQLLELEDEL